MCCFAACCCLGPTQHWRRHGVATPLEVASGLPASAHRSPGTQPHHALPVLTPALTPSLTPPPTRQQMKDIMMTRKARKMYQGLQKSRAAKQARVAALEQKAAQLKE